MLTFGQAGNVDITKENLEKFAIPKAYLQMEWNSDVLIAGHPQYKDSKTFIRYVKALNKTITEFADGLIPTQSMIFIAPQTFGKQTFANCCLKEAMSHGYSVVPILDNTQIKRINLLSADKPNSDYLRLSSVTIEDLNQADVCFVTIDSDNYQNALKTAVSLMDKRARWDKPTFILSRYTLKQMSKFDYSNTYLGIVDTHRNNNNMRYPAIFSTLGVLV
jgi:hypothetical protein